MRVLVTEELSDQGLELLRGDAQVDVRLDLASADLAGAIEPYDALIIRSATQVTAEVLAAATNLKVVARAGIGLDNVDVEEATRRGVMVVNAPQSNVISAAEHTLALLLSQARNVPQAHADLVQGRWERKTWEGVELAGKTLGLVGLGRVGSLVGGAGRCVRDAGDRVRPLRLDTSGPRRWASRSMPTLEALLVQSDFVSIHLPRTAETEGMIGAKELRMMKAGARLMNTARGGIVDEDALAKSLEDGHLGGAALDVFSTEPATDSPLYGLPNVVVTPHLGASTREAQDKAGVTVAEMVRLALRGEFVPYAVNVSGGLGGRRGVRPFVPLAEHLGAIAAGIAEGGVRSVVASYLGRIAEHDTRVLTLADPQGDPRRHDGGAGHVREHADARPRPRPHGERDAFDRQPGLRLARERPGRDRRRTRHLGGHDRGARPRADHEARRVRHRGRARPIGWSSSTTRIVRGSSARSGRSWASTGSTSRRWTSAAAARASEALMVLTVDTEVPEHVMAHVAGEIAARRLRAVTV